MTPKDLQALRNFFLRRKPFAQIARELGFGKDRSSAAYYLLTKERERREEKRK